MKKKILIFISVFLLLFASIVRADVQLIAQKSAGMSVVGISASATQVFTADAVGNVQGFDYDGNPIGSSWNAGMSVVGISASATQVFIVDAVGNVQGFDYDGNPIGSSWNAGMSVVGISASATQVFTADAAGNVQGFDYSGNAVDSPWNAGMDPGIDCVKIAVGNTILYMLGNDGVVKAFNADGGFLGQWGGTIIDISADINDVVYALDAESKTANINMYAGVTMDSIPVANPSGVAAGQPGYVFVVDNNSSVGFYYWYKNITTATSGSGTVSPFSGSYPGGTTVTVTATPGTGQKVGSFKVNGTEFGSMTSLSFSMVRNYIVEVTFIPNRYTVTTTAVGNGTISGAGTYDGGTTVTVTATPGTGQKVGSFKVNGTNYGAITSKALSMNQNYIVEVTFVANTYIITTSAGSGGTITPTATVTGGSNFTVTATPNAGNRVSSMAIDGANYGAISSFTFNNVTRVHTVSVTFVAN